MRKGKTGVYLAFYAVLAFVFAILQLPTLAALTLGFAIIVEKDEWLTRQGIQAVILALATSVTDQIFDTLDVFGFIGFRSIAHLWVNLIVMAMVIVFAISAMINVSKEKEANIPIANNIAKWAFGKVENILPPTPQQQAPNAYPAQPTQQQAPNAYPAQPTPQQQAPNPYPVQPAPQQQVSNPYPAQPVPQQQNPNPVVPPVQPDSTTNAPEEPKQ